MRVPLSWLRDFAPFEGDVDALASALTGLGLVVTRGIVEQAIGEQMVGTSLQDPNTGDNVYFLNCTFEVQQEVRGQEFATAVLSPDDLGVNLKVG